MIETVLDEEERDKYIFKMKYRKTFNGQNASWTKFAIIYPSRVSQMRRFRPGENLITGQRGRTRFHVVAEDDEEEREGKRIQRRRRPHGLAHAAHAHAHAAHAHAAHAASSEKETEEEEDASGRRRTRRRG